VATLKLNSEQTSALDILLRGDENVFLTGVAGSGKTHLLKQYLQGRDEQQHVLLASTGAAAILLGGRTFHSFFGLGIMEGGIDATVERALNRPQVVRRLKKCVSIAIDEISMISGPALNAAERIAGHARESSNPWGGIRVVACGDFAQLPPVSNNFSKQREWAFLDNSWERSYFQPTALREVVRTKDREFLEVLNSIRIGKVDEQVIEFLKSKTTRNTADVQATRLYPRRDMAEKYNLMRLSELSGDYEKFPTIYTGKDKAVEDLKKVAPVPELLMLKKGALVMLRTNDPVGRWANGSLGTVEYMDTSVIRIELLSGASAEIEPATFDLLDAEGKKVATAQNFPLNLAYATTIHKAQGATLDQVVVNLQNLWEPGHAYVALSRVKSSKGLFIEAWNQQSIKVDANVARFHAGIFTV
jgi:ATP-dependent DNA helicase PIF1